jgi:tetratricopeptide (TPR) repeat protein
MKRKERHHLKENELAQTILAARGALEARKGRLTALLVAALVIGAIVAGITLWRQRDNVRAQQLLADAMVTLNARVVPATVSDAEPGKVPAAATMGAIGSYPTAAAKLTAALPKLKAAADAYPNTEAGITARYHYAASLAALGRHEEAVQLFDDVARRAGDDSLYGQMARLGKADTQARAGQLDAAITTWKELAARADDALPKDAILMELAKAYQAAGNQAEARKTLSEIVDKHPTSPYSGEAKAQLGS